jgi:hypothetical protein
MDHMIYFSGSGPLMGFVLRFTSSAHSRRRFSDLATVCENYGIALGE